MQSSESHAARLLRALSRVLGRELDLSESAVEEDGLTVSRRKGEIGLSVRANGTDLSAAERETLEEYLELVTSNRRCRSDFMALDERLRYLERENVDLVMKNRALADVSSRDALTGLYARWYVLEKIEEEINRAIRHGSPMALLMVDLDHFKMINDSYGHRAGDEVLQAMGQVLRDSCRVYDVPGRYGGEEFCLMLPETRIGNTGIVAERIRTRVESTRVHHDSSDLSVTASIGVAGLDEGETTGRLVSAAALIERADQALYRAKNMGRNRIETWLQNGDFSVEH